MKKTLRLITLSITAFAINIANAQIDGNTNIAPNFQLYDTDGNYVDLYADYLDNGIPVIIDIMAHWCPPCWTYSLGGALETVYDEYGPNGTVTPNSVMVFMADGDATSSFAELYNVGLTGSQSTMGDWMSITGYPIFGGDTGVGANAGSTIANLYQISYFPTIYIIHPDRTVEEIGQIGNVAGIMTYVNNAGGVGTHTTDLELKSMGSIQGVCSGKSTSSDFIMKNMGTTTMTSATIDVEVNDVVVNTINWTGNLDQYNIETVMATIPSVIVGNHTMKLVVKDVNNSTDEDLTNNELTRSFDIKQVDSKTYTLSVQTDDAGNETSWYIEDGAKKKVLRKEDFNSAAYSNATLYTHEIELSNPDCYKLVVTDAGQDGMSGYVSLKDEKNKTIAYIQVTQQNDSRTWESIYALGLNENQIIESSIYPNPMNDILNVNLSLLHTSKVKIEIVNILGEIVFSKNYGQLNGNNSFTISTENLTNGVYFLNTYSDDIKSIHKVIK